MSNPFTKAMTKILQLVVKHQNYLINNPPQLAKLMKEYDLLHYASRHHDNENLHDWENLKYAVIDLEEVVSPFYASLVYDAWASIIRDEESSGHPLEDKPNKTMDDYFKMCLDPKYRYHSLYPNRQFVLNHYLCGYFLWNAQGYLKSRRDVGPCENDLEQFKGSQTCKLPANIQKSLTWLTNKEINLCKKRYHQAQVKHRQENDKLETSLKEIEKFLKKADPKKYQTDQLKKQKAIDEHPYSLISKEYSAIYSIPDNAHPSFKAAAIEVCEGILTRPKEHKANKTIAKQILKRLKNGN
jgi:hypothetical protein